MYYTRSAPSSIRLNTQFLKGKNNITLNSYWKCLRQPNFPNSQPYQHWIIYNNTTFCYNSNEFYDNFERNHSHNYSIEALRHWHCYKWIAWVCKGPKKIFAYKMYALKWYSSVLNDFGSTCLFIFSTVVYHSLQCLTTAVINVFFLKLIIYLLFPSTALSGEHFVLFRFPSPDKISGTGSASNNLREVARQLFRWTHIYYITHIYIS